MQSRTLRILSVLMVLVVGSIVLWKMTSRTLEQNQASADPLSQAIAERWGGGLPDGYTAETADDLERGGCLFARLAYGDSVAGVLENWGDVSEEEAAAFADITAAHAALPDLPEDHRALLEAVPTPGDGWLGYLQQEDGARIVLLYDPDGNLLYVAEQQPQ